MTSDRGISRRDLFRHGSATCAAIAVFASGTNVHGQRKREMRFVVISHSNNATLHAPHMVALELGFFREHGMTCTLIAPGAGTQVAQIVASGQGEFGIGDTSHPVLMSQRGRPAVILFSTDTRCSYANIVVRKPLWDQGLRTVEQLATTRRADGSPLTIAATALGAATWIYGNYVLSQYRINGRTVNEQVKWSGGGESTIMLGGLKSGQFDAIMALPQWIETARTEGYGEVLYDVTSLESWTRVFKGNLPNSVGYALKSTVADEPELTQDYVTSIHQAMRWLRGRNPEEVYERIGVKYMSPASRHVVVNEVKYYQAIFNYDLVIPKADFDNVKRVFIPLLTKTDFSYADLTDMGFAEKARQS
jgi:sulfonate transport system substrate-binding protein